VGLQVQVWNDEPVVGVPCQFALNEDSFEWYDKVVATSPIKEVATEMAKLNVQESGQVVPNSVMSLQSSIIETQPVQTQYLDISSPWKGNLKLW
jgi:hypothetical protein